MKFDIEYYTISCPVELNFGWYVSTINPTLYWNEIRLHGYLQELWYMTELVDLITIYNFFGTFSHITSI